MATKLTLKDLENISLAPITESERVNFCKSWPIVKDGLLWLKDKIKNEIIKAIIQLAIAIGDDQYKKKCPVPKKLSSKKNKAAK